MVLNYPRLYPHIEDTIYHIHIRLLCIHRASVNKLIIYLLGSAPFAGAVDRGNLVFIGLTYDL